MTSSDSAESMQEIDSDADGLVSRDEVEAWWDDRSPPHKAVFTAAEERERRESQRAIERKFKAREAEMGRRISDAERQVKVEVAKRVQQEQLLRAEMQTSRSLRVDAGQLAEAPRHVRHLASVLIDELLRDGHNALSFIPIKANRVNNLGQGLGRVTNHVIRVIGYGK